VLKLLGLPPVASRLAWDGCTAMAAAVPGNSSSSSSSYLQPSRCRQCWLHCMRRWMCWPQPVLLPALLLALLLLLLWHALLPVREKWGWVMLLLLLPAVVQNSWWMEATLQDVSCSSTLLCSQQVIKQQRPARASMSCKKQLALLASVTRQKLPGSCWCWVSAWHSGCGMPQVVVVGVGVGVVAM
jgi:hypothetical protein